MNHTIIPQFDIALAADMCVDLVLKGNVRPQFQQVEQLVKEYSLEIGGSANIFASQMAKLGARVCVIGYVGLDLFGDFLLHRLRETSVGTGLVRCDPAVRTGLGVSLTEQNDRAILTFLGGIAAVGPADLPSSPKALTRHWHVASFFLMERLRPVWKTFLTQCRSAGVTVSFDSNWDPQMRWEGVHDLLPSVDVFLPNEQEALAISGEPNPIAAGRALSKLGPLVVVKRGEKGAIAIRGDRHWESLPERPVAVADTIGAGDNFDAGFVCGWLSGSKIEDCLALAHRCAAASLAAAGGIEGQLRKSCFASGAMVPKE
ncbi:MAG: sugar kinase [Acidobacteriota bacterium]